MAATVACCRCNNFKFYCEFYYSCDPSLTPCFDKPAVFRAPACRRIASVREAWYDDRCPLQYRPHTARPPARSSVMRRWIIRPRPLFAIHAHPLVEKASCRHETAQFVQATSHHPVPCPLSPPSPKAISTIHCLGSIRQDNFFVSETGKSATKKERGQKSIECHRYRSHLVTLMVIFS